MKRLILALLLLLAMCSPSFARWTSVALLSAVTGTGASTDIDAQNWSEKTFYIVASGVTSGATVKIQTSPDNTNWVDLSTQTITANGTTEVAVTGLFHRYVRANVTAYTDGTYTVTLFVNE